MNNSIFDTYYQSAVKKWGKEAVDECLEFGWDICQIEKGYIITTQALGDYLSINNALNNKEVIIIDHIDDLVSFSDGQYDENKKIEYALKDGKKVDSLLLDALKVLDPFHYKFYCPLQCDENTNLLHELMPYIKEKLLKYESRMICENCDFDLEEGTLISISMTINDLEYNENLSECIYIEEFEEIDTYISDFIKEYEHEHNLKVDQYNWGTYCPQCLNEVNIDEINYMEYKIAKAKLEEQSKNHDENLEKQPINDELEY